MKSITTVTKHHVGSFTTDDIAVAGWYALLDDDTDGMPYLEHYKIEQLSTELAKRFGFPPERMIEVKGIEEEDIPLDETGVPF